MNLLGILRLKMSADIAGGAILCAIPGDFLGYKTWGILLQDHCLLDAGLAARALGSNPSRAVNYYGYYTIIVLHSQDLYRSNRILFSNCSSKFLRSLRYTIS